MHLTDCCLTKATFRRVDDALKGQIVCGLGHDAQISHCIADFEAFIETRTTDNPVIEAERHEAIFKFAHLERCAHEDRHVVEQMALSLRLFDRFANCTGFFLRIPSGVDFDFRIVGIWCFGEKCLTEASFIVRDQMSGCAKNMRCRAIVALKLDNHCAREILIEAENVIHFRTTPAIDRLIVVTNAAQVYFVFARAEFALITGSHWCRRP